jgi:predicted O-methyltransferase YrrM
VHKLLSSAHKEEKVHRSKDFLQLLRQGSLAVLDNIITTEESAVSFHTSETKNLPNQWVKKDRQAL